MKEINGILLLDKPLDITSAKALAKAKHSLKAKKAGHTGSLDPLATGLLPLCFGEATKFSQFLLDAYKTYSVTMKLGEKTETGDTEGNIIQTRPVLEINDKIILDLFSRFLGPQKQIPSMYSALKQNGVPLYELARKGITVERPARDIDIVSLDLEAIEGPNVNFTVQCSKGTYIRNLVEDMGDSLGCGAHVTRLRRVQVGDFHLADAVSLDTLAKNHSPDLLPNLLPIDSLLSHLDKVNLEQNQVYQIKTGQKIGMPNPLPSGQLTRLYGPDSQFLGLGEWLEAGRLKAKRLLVLGATNLYNRVLS